MAGWLASGCQRAAGRKAALGHRHKVRLLPEMRGGIVRRGALRLVGHQQLHHHGARLGRTLRGGFHLHAHTGHALARGGQHALAFDLDHAGAAVSVRPIARLGFMAKVRDVRTGALRHRPDGFTGCRLDLFAIQLKEDAGFAACVIGFAAGDGIRRRLGRGSLVARRTKRLQSRTGRAALWDYCSYDGSLDLLGSHELWCGEQLREKTNNAGQRIGRGLAQTADRGIAHALRQFTQKGRVPNAAAPSAREPSACLRGKACTGRRTHPRRNA